MSRPGPGLHRRRPGRPPCPPARCPLPGVAVGLRLRQQRWLGRSDGAAGYPRRLPPGATAGGGAGTEAGAGWPQEAVDLRRSTSAAPPPYIQRLVIAVGGVIGHGIPTKQGVLQLGGRRQTGDKKIRRLGRRKVRLGSTQEPPQKQNFPFTEKFLAVFLDNF